MTNLPTDIEPGDPGHIVHSDSVHALLNPVDAPFVVAPILVEPFYADRPAAGQAGRLFGAVDTGALEFDDGALWRGITSLSFVDSLTDRDALSPATDTVVIIRDINRMHRWNGTRWAASDEVHGINAIDYGFVGDDVHDDRQSVIDAAQVAKGTSGVGGHKVLIPNPPVRAYFSASIDVNDLGGSMWTIEGQGGHGYPSGGSQFLQAAAVPIRCPGPLFTTTGTVSANLMLRYLDAFGGAGQLWRAIPTIGDGNGIAGCRMEYCGATPDALGTTDNAPILMDSSFWCSAYKCALNGANVATTTTSSTTLSASFTMNVTSTTGMPSKGYVVIGTPYSAGARVVEYTGKTGTTLTGCKTVDTGTFVSGSTVTWRGPIAILRGGVSASYVGVTYLIDFDHCIGSGQGIRYEQVGPNAGPGTNKIRVTYMQIENAYLGSFNYVNTSGATQYLHDLRMEDVTPEDSLAPASALNCAVMLDGTSGTTMFQSTLDGCDAAFAGGFTQIYARASGCSVAAEVRGLNSATFPVGGVAGTVINNLVASGGGGVVVWAGTTDAYSYTHMSGSQYGRLVGTGGSAYEVLLTVSAGSPNGVVTSGPGSLCCDITNGKLYVKASGTGSSGWVVAGTQT